MKSPWERIIVAVILVIGALFIVRMVENTRRIEACLKASPQLDEKTYKCLEVVTNSGASK